ncbi:MAG: DHH family phosphoesterase [Candidatus Micrarchaeia archaeon]
MGKDKDRNDRTGKLALLVTSVKQVDSKFVISGITKDGRAVVNCNKRFMPGEFIEADGELHETENIKEMSAERVVLSDERKVKREIGKYIDSNVKVLSSKPYIADAVMKRLSRRLDEAARKILKAIFMHRPIIIRHHNDTDGVCSGLALYIAIGRAKNVKVIINKYPAYRMVEAQQDIDLLRSLDAEYLPPLLVIMDFGSSIDSFDTYDYVRKSGFEIVVVDHHPLDLKNMWIS